MHRSKSPKDPAITQSHVIALRVSLGFLVIGAAWVIVTELLVYSFVHDRVMIGRVETTKGWIFVAFAASVLFVTTNRAVRRLARSNATLDAIITSISDGVFLVSREGTITRANPAIAHMLGSRAADGLLGLNAAEFVRRFQISLPNGHLLAPDKLASLRALSGEQPPPYKAIIHPPGQPEVVALVTAAPVRPVPEGPVALVVSVVHDVTAIEHIDKMRDAFVSSAAHTLKTPVAVINAQVDLLASGKTSSVKASTDSIKRQAGRIARLTENLLVLARIKSDSLDLAPAPVDLASLVHEVAGEMEEASPDHKLRTTVRAHPLVFADRDRLALVIRNLIEVAYRRSLPRTDVELLLDEPGLHGRVAVSYRPVASVEVFAQWDADAGFAGLGLEHYVNGELMDASKGMHGSHVISNDRRDDWIQIPTMEESSHA